MVNNPVITLFVNAQDFFASLLPTLISAGFAIGAVIFVFNLLSGIFSWITSGGDKSQIEGARQKISNVIIGFVVLLALFAIGNIVGCFFRINFFQVRFSQFNIGFDSNPLCPATVTTPPPPPPPDVCTPACTAPDICQNGICVPPPQQSNTCYCDQGAVLTDSCNQGTTATCSSLGNIWSCTCVAQVTDTCYCNQGAVMSNDCNPQSTATCSSLGNLWFCNCIPNSQCNAQCSTNPPYFCSSAIVSGNTVEECCRCLNGNQLNENGPVECCPPPGSPGGAGCRVYLVDGCKP